MKLSWRCQSCSRDCFPIRSESRCLCGHRLKEHAPPGSSGFSDCKYAALCSRLLAVKRRDLRLQERRCSKAGCSCKAFFYIVAGAESSDAADLV